MIIKRGSDVERGDVVLFAAPSWNAGPDLTFVKRVVAVGGDTVTRCDPLGRLQVNGRPIIEDYLRTDPPPGAPDETRQPFTATVPQGRVFPVGDWRTNSRDARSMTAQPNQGTIAVSDIHGRAVGLLSAHLDIRSVPATPAFRDAGLAGPSTGDNGYLYLFAGSLLGPLLTVAGVLWLVVLGLIRVARRARLVRRGGTAGADGT